MKQLVLIQKPINTFIFLFTLFHFTSAFAYQAGLQVTVVDEKEIPLAGVNVYTDDFEFSSETDLQGTVSLIALEQHKKINFSYLGYKPQVITIKDLQEKGLRVVLAPIIEELETIVIIGRRNDQSHEIPFASVAISQSRLAMTNPQTSADALRDHAGVFVQKSQMGGGSPVIRGFEANRVLLVVDGVRLNNAIYRNGHLQNSITVDQASLEEIEVLFGPGSIMYGSDALGGVVHFQTKTPKLFYGGPSSRKKSAIQGNYYTRYASANTERSAHFDLNYGRQKWAMLTSATYTNFGDLRIGNNRPSKHGNYGQQLYYVERIGGADRIIENDRPNLLRNTGYQQVDFLQKIRFQPNEHLNVTANLQYSNSSDISRFDQLSETTGNPDELRFADWHYGPQERLLASLQTQIWKPTLLFNRANFIVAFQDIDEDRYDRRTGRADQAVSMVDVKAYSFTADFDKNLCATDQHVISYGVDIMHNDVQSDAFARNIEDGTINTDVNARYPSGGSILTTLGAYANYRWRIIKDQLVFNAGARYNTTHMESVFQVTDPIEWPQSYLDGVESKNNAFTWATGLNFSPNSNWQIRALSATGFRSPNVDDFSKIREKNGTITVPNPELKPERAWTNEITISRSFGKLRQLNGQYLGQRLQISGTIFHTQLQDAIVREQFFLPDGSPVLDNKGDELAVLANVNADEAIIYGISGNIHFQWYSRWTFKTSLTYTKGERTFIRKDEMGNFLYATKVPQDHIPPIYGQTSLAFRMERFNIEGVVRYNGRKARSAYAVTDITYDPDCGIIYDREGSSDNIEQSLIGDESKANCQTHYLGTPAWMTLNIYGTYKFSEKLSLNLGLENITDVHYRPFSSGISAPGRNIIIALRGSF